MTTMNIAGLVPVDDPSYRYKMPRMTAKVEGRGNGIKTVLPNIVEVALSLNREAPEVTKFFGCELGSQTTYATDTDRAVVNGAHTVQDLQTHLSKYIENFVLCKQCRLPETVYKIKAGAISQKCLACGCKESVDMTHKLTTFILAQRKKAKEAAAKTDAAAGKADKKEKKKKSKEDEEGGSPPASTEDGTDVTPKPEKEKKVKKEKKEKDSSKKKHSAAADESEEGSGRGLPTEAEEEDSNDRAIATCSDRLRLWRLDNEAAPLSAMVEEIRLLQTFSSLRVQDRVLIFLRAFFTEAVVTGNEVDANSEMLALLAPNAVQQRHLISGFEWLVGVHFPQLLKLFPVVLKQLYEAELVEEEVFYAWAVDNLRNEHTADPSMMTVETLEHLRASSKLFITWLQEAEEEGEEGEEDEEEEEGSEEEEG